MRERTELLPEMRPRAHDDTLITRLGVLNGNNVSTRDVAHVDVSVPWARQYRGGFGAGDGVVEVDHGCVERRQGGDFMDRGLSSHLRQYGGERKVKVKRRTPQTKGGLITTKSHPISLL